MATGESLKETTRLSGHSSRLTPDSHSPAGSRDGSPTPDRLSTLQHSKENDPTYRSASPRLPLQTLEELQSVDKKRQEKGWDPDDPPLSTPWTFWFQR